METFSANVPANVAANLVARLLEAAAGRGPAAPVRVPPEVRRPGVGALGRRRGADSGRGPRAEPIAVTQ
jgi:hypothetical protein